MVDICKSCILPGTFPFIRFNENGICHYCVEDSDFAIDFKKIRAEVEAKLKESLGRAKAYDIVLAFSGGKDSTYALKYFKENFDARLIAITIDNGFISERAYENCRIVTANLGVDHIFLKPNSMAMKEIYRVSAQNEIHSKTALQRASSICNSCIQIINTQIVNFASAYGIPFVAGGYIGGQVPSKTGFMEQDLKLTGKFRVELLKKLTPNFSPRSIQLFEQIVTTLDQITVINPMVYLNLREEEIIEEISSTGWLLPSDTGKSSTNCLLNDFAIKNHYEKYHYHPYVFEIATMVRRKIITREEGLKKVEVNFDQGQFKNIEEALDLKS